MTDQTQLKAIALAALGLAAMVGDFTGSDELRGIAAATAASPAPKLFSSAHGLEAFSSRFVIEYQHQAQGHRRFELTPRAYQQLAGPYSRRKVYGAVVSDGPVLAAVPETAKLFDSAARYSFCGDAPLLRELGLEPTEWRGPPVLSVLPRAGTEVLLPLRLEVRCR